MMKLRDDKIFFARDINKVIQVSLYLCCLTAGKLRMSDARSPGRNCVDLFESFIYLLDFNNKLFVRDV